MNSFQLIDFIQRKINSILFRFLIIGYSLVITIWIPNEFPFLVYVAAIVTYFIIYLSLLRYDRWRMLNDFVFIAFVLYGKNPTVVMNYSFLILPVFNSINFSGNRKSILLYVYTIGSYFFLYSVNSSKEFSITEVNKALYNLTPIIALSVINTYTSLRHRIGLFRDQLNEVVDAFYLKTENLKKPHSIYKDLIHSVNDAIKKNIISDIVCLEISGLDKITIVNGSKFIWKFRFENDDAITRIRKDKVLKNESLSVDKHAFNYNLILYAKVDEFEYLFVFLTNENIPSYYYYIGMFRTLEPAFIKMSRILISEKRLVELRIDEVTSLSQRSQYVNRANKAMHFIRNRLGPISNLLKMIDTFDSIEGAKQDGFKKLLVNECKTSRTELSNIIKRADDMLEKRANPFVYTSLKDIYVEKIFIVVNRNFGSFFPDVEIGISILSNINRLLVRLNLDGFEIVLSDWLSNMSKYSKDQVTCDILVDNEFVLITFANDFTVSEEEISQIISDLTSNDRIEIVRRTTHGLFTIKTTLEEMSVPFDIQLIESMLVLTIKLKIYHNESSNI